MAKPSLFQRIVSDALCDPVYAGLIQPCLWVGRWGGDTTCRAWWLGGIIGGLESFDTSGAYMCGACHDTFAAFRVAISRDPSERGGL